MTFSTKPLMACTGATQVRPASAAEIQQALGASPGSLGAVRASPPALRCCRPRSQGARGMTTGPTRTASTSAMFPSSATSKSPAGTTSDRSGRRGGNGVRTPQDPPRHRGRTRLQDRPQVQRKAERHLPRRNRASGNLPSWAATASASRARSKPSSNRAMTRMASCGPSAWPHLRCA